MCDSGIYHFNSTAFVYQDKVGIAGSGSSFKCVAPIVVSKAQTKVVFWAADASDCCSKSSSTCWNSYTTTGTALNAFPLFRYMSAIDSKYEAARQASCNMLAFNTSATGSYLCSLPAVYLTVDANPEETAARNKSRGFLFAGLMTGLWPCVLGVLVAVIALLALLDK
jgi:hypothetical protein